MFNTAPLVTELYLICRSNEPVKATDGVTLTELSAPVNFSRQIFRFQRNGDTEPTPAAAMLQASPDFLINHGKTLASAETGSVILLDIGSVLCYNARAIR